MRYHVPAVVVGLCNHGLAICRSLGRHGISVVALESDTNLPGLKTRYASKKVVSNINDAELIEDLILTAQELPERPVLFLTNDNMVRAVANNYEEIIKSYRINWPSPEFVMKMLEKRTLVNIIKSSGLLYPRTYIVSGYKELRKLNGDLRYPVALKPSTPLSPFKSFQISNESELRGKIEKYNDIIKTFIVQEWISGSERNIFFINFYFNRYSKAIASFVGQKIRSFPRLTGGACSAEPSDRHDLLETGLKFFEKLPIKGPASLEIKEDKEGRQFVIEPTIGRFDYYIHCCTANGVDMPFVSYAYQCDIDVKDMSNRKKKSTVWMDFEKDFPVLLESLGDSKERKEALLFLLKKKVFAVWSWDDAIPSFSAWPKGVMKYFNKIVDRLKIKLF